MMYRINEACRNLVKQFESLRLAAYRCPAGVLTIGWGHTANVHEGSVITTQQAEQLLDADLQEAAGVISRLVDCVLNENQFGALVSFVFNVGAQAFEDSTLLKDLNAGLFDQIVPELKRWHHANNKDLPGLVVRRAAEGNLWNSAEGLDAAMHLVDTAAAAAVAVQNSTWVDAARTAYDRIPPSIANETKKQAVAAVLAAVEPHLTDTQKEIIGNLVPVVDASIERAVAYLKLPDATLALFPDQKSVSKNAD